MEFGFVTWLMLVVVGSLVGSAVSWNVLQRRLRRNRDGRCAKCAAVLDEQRRRIGGLVLCPNCARRSRQVVRAAVRAIAFVVLAGSVAMLWAVLRVWRTNPSGARLMLGLWALYAGVLAFIALLSARDAREAARRSARIGSMEQAAGPKTPAPPSAGADTHGVPRA